MFTEVLAFTLILLSIYEVHLTSIPSSTEEQKAEELEGYIELSPPYIRILSQYKKNYVLLKNDLVNLKKFLKPNSTELVLFELVSSDGWTEILSDHQLQRLANHDVIAIIKSKHVDALRSLGFAHKFLYMKNDGELKFFKFNFTLVEAIAKLPLNHPYNFALSKYPYHKSFLDSLKEDAKD